MAGQSGGSWGTAADQLYCPFSLFLDSNKSIYIADSWNNRIQKWASGASSGTTVVGQANGAAGASSTALTKPVRMIMDVAGNMYLTDRGNHRVMYWANGASSGTTIAGTTGKKR